MNEIKLSTVKISKKGIYEVEKKRDLIFVPRERISSIKLLYGCGVQRPKIQTFLAIAFILIPLYFCLPPFFERLSDTNSKARVSQVISNYNDDDIGRGAGLDGLLILSAPLFFIVIGIFFLIELLKKKFYLIVKMKTENKKIVFREKVSQPELYQFIEQANNNFGYSITIELKNHT